MVLPFLLALIHSPDRNSKHGQAYPYLKDYFLNKKHTISTVHKNMCLNLDAKILLGTKSWISVSALSKITTEPFSINKIKKLGYLHPIYGVHDCRSSGQHIVSTIFNKEQYPNNVKEIYT